MFVPPLACRPSTVRSTRRSVGGGRRARCSGTSVCGLMSKSMIPSCVVVGLEEGGALARGDVRHHDLRHAAGRVRSCCPSGRARARSRRCGAAGCPGTRLATGSSGCSPERRVAAEREAVRAAERRAGRGRRSRTASLSAAICAALQLRRGETSSSTTASSPAYPPALARQRGGFDARDAQARRARAARAPASARRRRSARAAPRARR